MIDQPGNDAGLVADFVQMALALADRIVWNLPDQRQHRRIHAIGGEQRRAGIEQTGAGHHAIGLRFSGRQRRAQSHIGRALLVAGMDDAQGIARAMESVEQMIVVDSRQRVDGIEAVGEQRGDRGLGGGHAGGGALRRLWMAGLSHNGQCADRGPPVEPHCEALP